MEHKTETFKEGRDIVLTLKDAGRIEHVCCVCLFTNPLCLSTGVLEDDSDVLVSVNIIDDEKAAKNVELRKGKPGYNPYEEEEVDEYGNVSPKIT